MLEKFLSPLNPNFAPKANNPTSESNAYLVRKNLFEKFSVNIPMPEGQSNLLIQLEGITDQGEIISHEMGFTMARVASIRGSQLR